MPFFDKTYLEIKIRNANRDPPVGHIAVKGLSAISHICGIVLINIDFFLFWRPWQRKVALKWLYHPSNTKIKNRLFFEIDYNPLSIYFFTRHSFRRKMGWRCGYFLSDKQIFLREWFVKLIMEVSLINLKAKKYEWAIMLLMHKPTCINTHG